MVHIRAFVTILFFIWLIPLIAEDGSEPSIIVLTDKIDHYVLSKSLDVFEDTSGKLTIEDIVKEKWQKKFKKNREKNPNFGYSKSTFWARFQLQNESLAPIVSQSIVSILPLISTS